MIIQFSFLFQSVWGPCLKFRGARAPTQYTGDPGRPGWEVSHALATAGSPRPSGGLGTFCLLGVAIAAGNAHFVNSWIPKEDQISHEVQRGAQRASRVVLGTSGLCTSGCKLGSRVRFPYLHPPNQIAAPRPLLLISSRGGTPTQSYFLDRAKEMALFTLGSYPVQRTSQQNYDI